MPVSRFVLDLRWNPGGETGLVPPIAKTLLASPTVNREGKFFVLIGRRTFSAAQLLCTVLDQYSNATFLGEPSGIRTHFYANARKNVVLPNSHLGVFLSTNWWQLSNRKDTQPWQRPDVAVDERYSDYAQDRDPTLAEAMRYQPGLDVAALFADAMKSTATDWEAVIAEFRAFKHDPRYRYVDTEATVNGLGYALMEASQVPTALRFFEFNTVDYPASANTYDSLAEAQLAAGTSPPPWRAIAPCSGWTRAMPLQRKPSQKLISAKND